MYIIIVDLNNLPGDILGNPCCSKNQLKIANNSNSFLLS